MNSTHFCLQKRLWTRYSLSLFHVTEHQDLVFLLSFERPTVRRWSINIFWILTGARTNFLLAWYTSGFDNTLDAVQIECHHAPSFSSVRHNIESIFHPRTWLIQVPSLPSHPSPQYPVCRRRRHRRRRQQQVQRLPRAEGRQPARLQGVGRFAWNQMVRHHWNRFWIIHYRIGIVSNHIVLLI